MESNYTKLIATLQECFMLDQADLDFGIYRIMNSRRVEIEKFLKEDLVPQVKAILGESGASDRWSLDRELAEALANAKSLWADPESLPKVREIRAKLAGANDLTALENEVFSHLANFFKRYFDTGDFISMRRYKKDVYAIPYEGEEVKLHWANADQYYIKTGEFFKNYRFRVASGKTIVFTLVEASTDQNNNKAHGDKERKFRLYAPSPSAIETGKPGASLEVLGGELHIYFTYEPLEKGLKQDSLIGEAFETVKSQIPAEFADGLIPAPTEKNKSRTVLEKHLNDYVKRNTFDYFIHKDLEWFLTRELDFYIKNEILYIDDIDTRSPDSFLGTLSMIKAVKQIGSKVIAFLAQLEEFQKKLFLKKKMVVETGYCITLDRIDPKFYDDIRANEAQIDDWVALFAIDELKGFSRPLTREFLEENPFLVLDTKHFEEPWKNKLIWEISESHNLDEWLDGLMINSENFQALNLLKIRYEKSIQTVYIDPPYNTPHSAILYKNQFKDSAWLTLINNSLSVIPEYFSEKFSFWIAIDDYEQIKLGSLLQSTFPNLDLQTIVMNHHPQWSWGRVSRTHEYYYILSDEKSWQLLGKPKDDEGEDRSFMRSWTAENNYRYWRWRSFYALLIDTEKNIVVWAEEPVPLWEEYPMWRNKDGFMRKYPTNSKSEERVWRSSYETWKLRAESWELTITEGWTIYQSIDNSDKRDVIFSNWIWPEYNAGINGTNVLTDLGLWKNFDYPKSIKTMETCLWVQSFWRINGTILDYFAWSWTTWHAVINLNRKDVKDGGEMGKRKYILVEMGEYFDTVTKPRIMKVVYSEDWKDGKPVSRKGSSHAFKYLRLESYEDVLNNLVLRRTETQQSVLFAPENVAFRESYMLGYLLDTESRGSVLSVDQFAHPFDCEMDITRNNETCRTRVDLVETFNYILGLVVEHAYSARGYRVVKGKTLQDEKILVVWRDLGKHSNDDLNEFLRKSQYNPHDTEFDRIYVNGDNSVENLKTGSQTWKVMLIEEEFKRKMFEV